jgi:hypothetical protein
MSARARTAIAIGLWLATGTGTVLGQAAPTTDHPGKVTRSAKHAHDAKPPPLPAAPAPSSNTEPAGNAGEPAAAPAPPPAAALPEGHEPKLQIKVEPQAGVHTGEIVHLEIMAEAALGDDVTVAEQSFAPFEVYKKNLRVEQPQGDRQRFVFQLDVLAFEPGDKPIPAITLRVVTKDNFVGTVKTPAVPFKVRGLLDNEPNAQPKLETKPVPVLEDNWIPVYILAGLLAAGLVALITVFVSRYLRKRKARAVPPPPPRPPWEIAVEELGALRRKKQSMIDAGQGGLFVAELNHVIRAYLGGRYHFDGLETTTDEMLAQLKSHSAGLGFTQEVGMFLGRCDLVKFAKVEPDADEVDLLFAKAQDLVQFSGPDESHGLAAPPPPVEPPPGAAADAAAPATAAGAAPRRSAAPVSPDDARKAAPAATEPARKSPPVDRGSA